MTMDPMKTGLEKRPASPFRVRPVALAGLLFAGSLLAHACGGASSNGPTSPSNGAPGAASAAGSNGKTCVDVHTIEECADFYALRTSLLIDLHEVEAERDQRNVPTGLDALTTGDPLLEAAGLSIVGPFPEAPGVAQASAKAMLEPFYDVQSLASAALEPNERYGRLSSQWKQGHKSSHTDEVHPAPFDPATYKLVVPKDAMPYPPGDSAVTAAYYVSGAPEAVLASLSAVSPATPLSEFQKTLSASVAKPDMDSLMARMKASQGDPKVMAELEKELQRFAHASEAMSLAELPMPGGDVTDTARAVALENDATGVKRWAVVYAEPLYGKTVIIFGWSPLAYPPRAEGS